MNWTIDRILMMPVGIGIVDVSGLTLTLDAQSANYLKTWLCAHVVELDKMAREQAEKENDELGGLFS